MIKKKTFLASNQKIISGVLLTFVVIGSVASLIAVFYPFMGLAAWKYVDGAPDAPSLLDDFIKFILSIIPILPWALILGGVSALLYTFIVDDSENKIFLRVWGGVMLLLFLMFLLHYM